MAELADILEEEFKAIEDFLLEGESLVFKQDFSALIYPAYTDDQEIASGNREVAELLAARKEKTDD